MRKRSLLNIMINNTNYILFVILFLIAIIFIPNIAPPHFLSIVTKALIFSLFAMSLNILVGYTGLFSLGHTAYFGVAGYAVALLVTYFGIVSFWISMPIAVLIAALLSAVFGIVALRMFNAYFLIITFALGQLVHSFFVTGLPIAGGWYGLSGVPRPQLGFSFSWNTKYYYYFTLLIVILCVYVLNKFVKSPFGLALQGIRENRVRMEALGYNTFFYKYVAFIVAGTFAGVAGVLFVHLNGIISPAHLGISYSSIGLLMVIIGGAGTNYGPIVGAFLMIFIEYFASLYMPQRWPLMLGGFFIVTVMFARGGITRLAAKLWRKGIHTDGGIKG